MLAVLAVLYALGFTNLFLRGSLGIMAPALGRDMALTPAALSVIASAFFFAYAAMQVPTGMLLDRFGPRRTLAALLLFTTAGAALFAVAGSTANLVAARILMGIGCAGVFTGAFYVLNLRLPPERVVTQSGALNSFASFGGLCATTPLALLVAWIGWRESYWLFTVGVVALLLAVVAVLRDGAAKAAKPESLREVALGVWNALRQPGMKRLLILGFPLSATTTITGIWGPPYLRDVHGLGDLGRGNMMLAMAVCGICGHMLYGQVARCWNTLKGVILGGGTIIILATGILAAVPQPPLWLVAPLFCLMGLTGAYPMMAFAHARGLVSVELVGRGIGVTNTGIMAAIAMMQLVFGWIVGAFAPVGGGPPEHAYRAGFACQALVAVLALLIYAPVRDCKPRG